MKQTAILILDDSRVVRASLRFCLEGAGLRVEEATNGREGLRQLQSLSEVGCRPAMIITDINMPEMDGLTFVREVKKTDARFIPIIVLTTESGEQTKAEGRAAGAAGWLLKPFMEQQLLQVVRKFVR